MFSNDTMIYPKETAWFQELRPDGSLLPTTETAFYLEDWLGLKTLNEAGKVHFIEWPGDHLQFSMQQVETVIAPFLKS